MAPAATSAVRALKKLMGAALSFLRGGFNTSKCKTEAKMATARIKLLRNRREAQVRQMRRDVAVLLDSGRRETAMIRVEHVIREQNVLAANEIIEVFCELIVARLSVIAKQRECPADLKEGIASLIYASPRCSEIPELDRIRYIFEKKYGKEFISAAMDLRPDSGVNHMLIEKLSARKPMGEVKLKILKEIAKEYHVLWDATETEQELLKLPDVLEGPSSFVSATSFPLKANSHQQCVEADGTNARSKNNLHSSGLQFKDSASAAQAAAESAVKAISAAHAAAFLSNQHSHEVVQRTNLNLSAFHQSISDASERPQGYSTSGKQSRADLMHEHSVTQMMPSEKVFNSHNLNESDNKYQDTSGAHLNDVKTYTRRNFEETVKSNIKFDDSDDNEADTNEELEVRVLSPENVRPALPPSQRNHVEGMPSLDSYSESFKGNLGSRIHPKLPDYEELAARFEALKTFRPRT